ECVSALAVKAELPHSAQRIGCENIEIALAQEPLPETSRGEWGTPQFVYPDFAYITQKRHPKPMTPYKSKPKDAYARIGTQERLTHRYSHPLQGMVCYDCGPLFAPVRHDPFSWYAWRLATSSPSCTL